MATLGKNQEALLREALRRFTRFHGGESLTLAWTGLGSATEYKPAVDGGYMVVTASGWNRGYDCWWRLTDKGAAIVQGWLDGGLTHRHIEEMEV